MSTKLPSGNIAFLFTDIEGSTQLAQRDPNEMPDLLARHDEILDRAIEARHGSVFQTAGDSFYVAFQTVEDALNAALEAQRSLHNESWSPAPIRVRMGLHTGFAEGYVDGYRGCLTLARVQRVMSCGHGGQILLSLDIREQVRDQLPPGVALRDLGRRHLKEIRQFCKLDGAGESLVPAAMGQMNLSAWGYHRVLKLARTIADLARCEMSLAAHLAEALQYRPRTVPA